MIELINYVKSLTKLEQLHIDNKVFKLHYKFTVVLLLCASILVTSKQYFGDPIDCYTGESDLSSILDTYCWITGTYVPERPIIKESVKPNKAVIPGSTNEYKYLFEMGTTQLILSQKYYQWVCLFLCFQAMCFYLPRYLWTSWEQGRLRSLVGNLNGPVISPNWTSETKAKLVNYIIHTRYSHNIYAIRFLFCEILNLVNVVVQIFLVDWFLTGEFGALTNVNKMFKGNFNPYIYTFPKMAKCQFYKVGPSGSQEQRDALCVLPLNILNEKVFAALWIWLYVLLCITVLAIFWHVLLFNSKFLRSYLLIGQSGVKRKHEVKNFVKYLSFGNYFVLHQIGKNINTVMYQELVEQLVEQESVYKEFDPKVAMQL